LPRPSFLFPLLVILGFAITGWGCDPGDDDDFSNSDGDDDVDAPASISGTMLVPVDSPYGIEEGTLLEVRAYAPDLWDAGANFPIAAGDYSGATSAPAGSTWPMVFTVPLDGTGTYSLWAFADAVEDGEIADEVYGLGQDNPVNVTSIVHVTGELILFDQFHGDPGDDDDDSASGDDDDAGSGDDDSAGA